MRWLVAVSLTATGCAAGIEPVELVETGERSITLVTSCHDEQAGEPSARLRETDDEVRIDRVSGTRADGDCLWEINLELRDPIGVRTVHVEGESWVRVDDDCEQAIYASIGHAEARNWRLPLPCDDDR